LTNHIVRQTRHEDYTMKLTHTLLALAIASAAVATPNALAQSADLTIIGTILPGACNITLGSNGVADYGDLRSSSLSQTGSTELEAKELSVTVSCDSAVRFAMQGVDNTGDSSFVTGRYGLGRTDDDERIGSAKIGLTAVNVDDANGFATTTYNQGETWSESAVPNPAPIPRDGMIGFATTQGVTTGPAAVKSMRGTLVVQAFIAPTDGMTLTSEVPIRGNATINVMYL
jgi:type 1 fimbria pilin